MGTQVLLLVGVRKRQVAAQHLPEHASELLRGHVVQKRVDDGAPGRRRCLRRGGGSCMPGSRTWSSRAWVCAAMILEESGYIQQTAKVTTISPEQARGRKRREIIRPMKKIPIK